MIAKASRAALVLLMLVGCDEAPSASDAPGSASASAPAPAGPKNYKATLNGKDVAFQSIIASNKGGSAVKVHFSTHDLKCSDLTKNGRMLADGERHFDVTLAPKVKTGEKGWTITKAYFGGNNKSGDLGEAEVSTSAKAKTIKVKFALEIAAAGRDDDKKDKITFDGEVDAKGCGTIRKKGDPKAKRQEALKLSVGSRFVVINGATIEKKKDEFRLKLSGGPMECKGFGEGDVVLELTLDASGKLTRAFARGDLMRSQSTTTTGLDSLKIKATNLAGGEPSIDLSGSLDIVGVPFTLSGKVTPERCEE